MDRDDTKENEQDSNKDRNTPTCAYRSFASVPSNRPQRRRLQSPGRPRRRRNLRALGLMVGATLFAGLLIPAIPAYSNDTTSQVVGTFSAGGNATAGINERTGALEFQIPLFSMPGANGNAVALGASYSQDADDQDD